jgi:cell division protein FtsW (lipid II flippase)
MDMKDNVTKGAVYGIIICLILLVTPSIAIATEFAPLYLIVVVVVYIAMLVPIAFDIGINGWLDIEIGTTFPPTEFILIAIGIYAIGGAVIGYIYEKTR